MGQVRPVGRPPAASREILEAAARAPSLGQGSAAAAVAEITRRAAGTRATFSDTIPATCAPLWTSVDDALDTLAAELERSLEPGEAEPGAGRATGPAAGDPAVGAATDGGPAGIGAGETAGIEQPGAGRSEERRVGREDWCRGLAGGEM